MPQFDNGLVLTRAGRALNGKILTNQTPLHVTGMAIGNGELPDGTPESDVTALISQVFQIDRLSVSVIYEEVALFEFEYSSNLANLPDGFYMREIGILADDPDFGEILYAYGNCGDRADFIPPSIGSTFIKRFFRIPVSIANARDIVFEYNDPGGGGANIGDDSAGAGPFARVEPESGKLMFKRIKAGSGLVITETDEQIIIELV